MSILKYHFITYNRRGQDYIIINADNHMKYYIYPLAFYKNTTTIQISVVDATVP